MLSFTLLGFPLTYIIIIALFYWCVDSRLGQRFAVFVLFAGSVNELFKRVFHLPRPYWIDSRVLPIGSASGAFGFPSGHAFSSLAWLYAGLAINKWWGWFLAGVIVFMVGLSRVYLGAHFPMQVVAGWLLGSALIAGCLRMESSFIEWMTGRSVFRQLAVVSVVAFTVLIAGWVVIAYLGNWQIPEIWQGNVAPHLESDETFNPLDFESVVTSVAVFLGGSVGIITMTQVGGFQATGTIPKRALRFFVGLICLLIILVVPAILRESMGIAEEPGILFWSWQFVANFLLLFGIFYLVPLVFRRLRLIDSGIGA